MPRRNDHHKIQSNSILEESSTVVTRKARRRLSKDNKSRLHGAKSPQSAKPESPEKGLPPPDWAAQFRLLVVDAVQDYAIFALDPVGNVRTWNIGAERIKQYTAPEIIGKHFSIFYADEDKRNGKPEQELEVAKKEGRLEDEGWRVRKDGSRFWANVVITALRDRSGKLVGFGKVTRDFTERMKTNEALAKSEKSLRELSLHLL